MAISVCYTLINMHKMGGVAMAILFHETTKTFHLYNDKISYIFTVLKNGHLGQLYFGKRLRDRADFSHLLEFTPRPMAACTFEGDLSFSLEHIRQEYPIFGTGDIRYPAFSMERPNGSRIYSSSSPTPSSGMYRPSHEASALSAGRSPQSSCKPLVSVLTSRMTTMNCWS